eukprot:6094515-Amphidinium_carterae.1
MQRNSSLTLCMPTGLHVEVNCWNCCYKGIARTREHRNDRTTSPSLMERLTVGFPSEFRIVSLWQVFVVARHMQVSCHCDHIKSIVQEVATNRLALKRPCKRLQDE